MPMTKPTSEQVTFLAAGSGASQRTVLDKLRDVVSVKDFGAVGDGVANDTAAIQAALAAASTVIVPDGTYRSDSTITIDANKALVLMAGATIKRLSAYTAATTPVVHVKGNYAKLHGGTVETQNNAPAGVVCCGHLNTTTSNWNSLFWEMRDVRVLCKDFGGSGASPYPGASDCIGIYVPSSQPQLGSSFANYYGTIANCQVHNATTSVRLTDLANAHTFLNCRVEFFYEHAFRLSGAYGNTFYGTFINGSYANNKTAVSLETKDAPAAPYASSLETMYNHFYGSTIELYTTGNTGFGIEANCQSNYLQFNWNSVGTPVNDLDGFNNIVESREAQFTTAKIRTTLGVGQATPATTGAGITYPATASLSANANTLDDYEEGVFAPTVIGSSTAGTCTYTTQSGYYTKIGNVVTASFGIAYTGHTGTGNMVVTGLPFSSGAFTNSIFMAPCQTTATIAATNIPFVRMNASSAQMDMMQQATGGGAITNVTLNVAASVYYTITYRT